MSDDFLVTEHLDQKSGLAHRTYKYKRMECRRVLLDSRLCNQLAGYTLIEKDLRSVLIWLNEIEARHTYGPSRKGEHFARSSDRTTYNLIKGFFVAALTFYGKCFSKCEGRPVKLERAQLDEQFYALHDECIAYRHNCAAHSGAKKLEHVEVGRTSLLILSQSFYLLFRKCTALPSYRRIRYFYYLASSHSISPNLKRIVTLELC